MSHIEKMEMFMVKYKEALRLVDREFIHGIKTHIRYNYRHVNVKLEMDKIVVYKEISLEEFANTYVTICDEHFKVIPHFAFVTEAEIEESLHCRKDILLSYKIDYQKEDIIKSVGERSILTHEYGPWSNYKDEDIQNDFFKCECGVTKGKWNLNLTCPECGKPVKEMDYSIDKFGYFLSDTGYKFLTYKGYQILNNLLSGTGEGIVDYLCSSRIPPTAKEKDIEIVKKYRNLYLYDVVEDLINEVLEPKKRIDKAKQIKFFLDNKDVMFNRYIPVISTAFRRFNATKTFDIDKIECFNNLNQLFISLSTDLWNLDTHLGTRFEMKYYYTVLKDIKKAGDSIHAIATADKYKYLRSGVMGLRQNNVIMAVLEPLNIGMKEDICVVNYKAVIALFTHRIEDYLLKKGVSLHDIHNLLNLDVECNEEEKLLLEEFVQNNNLIVEFNRQPTIALQSSLPILIAGLTDENVIYMHPITCAKVASDHDKSVTFILIKYRCNNAMNCWKALRALNTEITKLSGSGNSGYKFKRYPR